MTDKEKETLRQYIADYEKARKLIRRNNLIIAVVFMCTALGFTALSFIYKNPLIVFGTLLQFGVSIANFVLFFKNGKSIKYKDFD